MRYFSCMLVCSSVLCAVVGVALGASCYVNKYGVACCDLALIQPTCRNCTIDQNCCDTQSSSGTVTHHTKAAPGVAGNTGTTAGASCTCTYQARRCSAQGYCVNFLDPLPESVTPSSAGGGSACQGSA